MLGSSKLEAFVGTTDAKKARHFYETVLGLSLIADQPFALLFDANGTSLRVSKVDEVSPEPYTVLGWVVSDIEAMTKALRKNGVVFERYPYFEQDENDIWTAPTGAKVAWFKDPDGNTLSVSQSA
jgi:catechol 2,3-dioxygenase-like lactoylglutathione lyase family enzyme